MFADNGNLTTCNICKMQMKVPSEYYCDLNEHRERTDKMSRPELNRGVYEFLAPKDYNSSHYKSDRVRIMICLEVTHTSLTAGIFSQVIATINQTIDYIPNPETTDLAICTYDQKMNFY